MSGPGDPAGHRDFEDMAVAHVLGGLEGEQSRLFRAHLLECAHCRARVGELRAIASDLAGVERTARREEEQQAAQRLDTKQADGEPEPAPAPRPSMAPRILVAVLLLGLMGMAAYAFVLRGQAEGLRQEVSQRAAASAVLVDGQEAALAYEAVGVDATVRIDGRDVAVLADGLDDDVTYRIRLVDDEADDPSGDATEPVAVVDGRLFVLVQRRVGDDRVRVERADGEVLVDAELGS